MHSCKSTEAIRKSEFNGARDAGADRKTENGIKKVEKFFVSFFPSKRGELPSRNKNHNVKAVPLHANAMRLYRRGGCVSLSSSHGLVAPTASTTYISRRMDIMEKR